MGILAGRFAAAERQSREISLPPRNSALGALLAHITGEANVETFQPMNVNFGLFPEVETPLDAEGKKPRGKAKGLPANALIRHGRCARWMLGSVFARTRPSNQIRPANFRPSNRNCWRKTGTSTGSRNGSKPVVVI